MINKMDAPTQPNPKINMNTGAKALHVAMLFAMFIEGGNREGSNGDDTSVIQRDPPHAWLVFGRFAMRRFP